jgi:hypothetical protein
MRLPQHFVLLSMLHHHVNRTMKCSFCARPDATVGNASHVFVVSSIGRHINVSSLCGELRCMSQLFEQERHFG